MLPALHWAALQRVIQRLLRYLELTHSGVAHVTQVLDPGRAGVKGVHDHLTGQIEEVNARANRAAVTFAMKGVPGEPVFSGKLAEDGKTIAGDFSQGGGAVPFKLTRTGEGKLEVPPKSTAISKELEGTWQGSVDAGGQTLRLVVKLSNGADGASGSVVSPDQNNAEFPISSITQETSHLKPGDGRRVPRFR